MRVRPIVALCMALYMVLCGMAAHAEQPALQNWFNDPFFQVTHADLRCPQPAGPFVDERGRREQAHRRAEKGTTCWLAGECERPKAYAYDAGIAQAVQRAFAGSSRFRSTTLWVTVQGRVVYIEGCGDARTARAAESLVRALPDVQQAVAIVRSGPQAPVPYRVMPADRPSAGRSP